MNTNKIHVIKRNGSMETVSFDKILIRIKNLCLDSTFWPLLNVDYNQIAKETIQGIYSGVTTKELDELAAYVAQPMAFDHPEYGILASRILVSNYHKNNINNILYSFPNDDIKDHLFKYVANALYNNVDKNGHQYPLIAPDIYKIIINNDMIEKVIDYRRDYEYDFMGFKMLEESYLQKCSIFKNNQLIRVPIERPQHLIMRIALGIHCSKKYVNFDKMRQNDQAILDELLYIFKKYLNHTEMKKLINRSNKNKVIWKEIIQIIKDQTVCYVNDTESELLKINETITKYTKSWNDLLNMYDGKIMNDELDHVIETYNLLSLKMFIHATPTLYNAGTLKPQLSSCFLLQLSYDSMDSISTFWKNCAQISKWAGGIGSNVHLIRSKGSYIRGTNGQSNGIPSMLKVVNDVSNYVDQGGHKRPGSHAVYLELWHDDIFDVISLKKTRGNDAERARNLFYGMWICDEFMRTVKYEAKLEETVEGPKYWYLMCPDQSNNLSNLYDQDFSDEWISDDILFNSSEMKMRYAFTYTYRSYILQGKYIRKVSAIELLKHICSVIEETGIPYMCFKDAANRKSNQKNLGTIKCSNLCTEIMEYTSSQETAVCNLSSINQTSIIVDLKPLVNSIRNLTPVYTDFIETSINPSVSIKKYIDWNLYEKIIRRQIINLNRIIDINYYPIKEAKYSNLKNRPIAIGSQDFANLLTLLRLTWKSDGAMKLNFYLYEFMYYIACDESCNEAIKHRNNKIKSLKESDPMGKLNKYESDLRSGSYKSFENSPVAHGLLQFDLWINEQAQVGNSALKYDLSLDWDYLKRKIYTNGMRNSLLI